MSAARNRSQALSLLLRLVGTVLVLLLLFHFLPGRQILRAMELLPTQLWAVVLAGYLAGHCFGIAKWRRMVNLGGAGLNFSKAMRCYYAGLFATIFLPSLIGGDLVRAGLALRLGRSKPAVLLGSVFDRILDFFTLALLATIGALLVPGAPNPTSRRAFWVLGGSAAVISAAVILVIVLVPWRSFSFRMRRRLVRLRGVWRAMARRPGAIVGALSFGIAGQLIFIFLSIWLAEACGLRLPFRAWLFAWPLAKLSASLPITQGGIGLREAALAALLLPFGAAPALTVAAGFAWDAIVISGALVAGLVSHLVGRIGVGKACEDASEEGV